MKSVNYSTNMYDSDGDCYAKCILIHINSHIILRFDNLEELKQFELSIGKCIKEIEQ